MSKPAFPVSPDHVDAHEDWLGLSMRDYFAAKALGGFVNALQMQGVKYDADAIAKESYELADAMMKAREVSR